MDLRPHILREHLSHAYVIEGEQAESLLAVRALIVHLNIATSGNPDYHEGEHDVFTVEDARELRRAQGLLAGADSKKIFIVMIRTINHEAQNALLKTIEEPTEHTHFFFLVRSCAILLPTIRSRVQIVRADQSDDAPHVKAEEFLSASIPERLKLVSHMVKAKADDKSEAKEEARVFLATLERLLLQKLGEGNAIVARSLEDIIYAERELSGRAPSLKLLLEHLALTIPQNS